MSEIYGAFAFYHNTQTSGTPITQLIPPPRSTNYKLRLMKLVYTAGATVHDILLMRALHQVETTAAAAAAATSLVLDEATFVGQTLANGDYVVVEHADGTYGVYLVSALATLTITINALSKAVNSGAKVFIMGAPGDTSYHSTLKSIASTRIEFDGGASGLGDTGYDDGVYDRDGKGDPMLIYSANGTNAGTLNHGSAAHVIR